MSFITKLQTEYVKRRDLLKKAFPAAYDFLKKLENIPQLPDLGIWMGTSANAHLYSHDRYLCRIEFDNNGKEILITSKTPKEIYKGTTNKSDLLFSDKLFLLIENYDDYREWSKVDKYNKNIRVYSTAPSSFLNDLFDFISAIDKNKDFQQPPKQIAEKKEDIFTEKNEDNPFDIILELLKKKKQIILYGPPGTGKTYSTKEIAIKILGGKLGAIGDEYKKYLNEGRIEFITFHPSYSYEEFIEGITVKTEGDDIPTESLQYVCKSGIFKNMCKRALRSAIGLVQDEINKKTWQGVYGGYIKKENIDFEKAAKYVLIIDEINRGDIAKILGELITLLEADKRLGEDNELIAKLPASGDEFCVPPNLYIIATMNTADRSLALLDVALRRRFGFIEMNPALDLINQNSEDIKEDARQLLIDSIEAVKKINREISKDKAIGRDKQIGHSFLFKVHTIDDLILAWRHEILPLLEEYCYSDYLKINQIVFGRDTDWISQTDGIKEINRSNMKQMLDEIIK